MKTLRCRDVGFHSLQGGVVCIGKGGTFFYLP